MKKVMSIVAGLGLVIIAGLHMVTSTKRSSVMQLTSSSFSPNGMIPKKYTCDGLDISPHLEWKDEPENTKSFVLICDDPDAPTSEPWVHWVVFNIPPHVHHFIEGQVTGVQGVNDFQDAKKQKYGGPCPPQGHGVHRYHFKLYALDTMLDLTAGATKKEVLLAMKGHIIGKTELIGTYERV